MPHEHAEAQPTEQKVLRLTQWQLVAVIITLMASLGSLGGTYFILPYRMADGEKAIAALETRVKALEDGRQQMRELMIRIDERTKSIQDKLKIPHSDKDAE